VAQLPPDGRWVIQQIGGEVILYHRDSEVEVVRFDPAEPASFGPAQQIIHESGLTEEAKSMAHFWSGYFYAHATGKVN